MMSPTSEFSGRSSTACASAERRKPISSSMMQVSTTKRKTGGTAAEGLEEASELYSTVVYCGKSSAGRDSSDMEA